jgi:hypothetical protein
MKIPFIPVLSTVVVFGLVSPSFAYLQPNKTIVSVYSKLETASDFNIQSEIKLTKGIRIRKGPQVPNPSSLETNLPSVWIYNPSPKHGLGGHGSKMDLKDAEAQAVLNRGLPVGQNVFAYFKKKFYIFRSERTDGNRAIFHGYPAASSNQIPAKVMKLMKERGLLN